MALDASGMPASVAPQGLRKLKQFRLIQVGDHPVRRLRAIPVEDLVALRVLLLNRVVGRALIGPQEGRPGRRPRAGGPAPLCEAIPSISEGGGTSNRRANRAKYSMH